MNTILLWLVNALYLISSTRATSSYNVFVFAVLTAKEDSCFCVLWMPAGSWSQQDFLCGKVDTKVGLQNLVDWQVSNFANVRTNANFCCVSVFRFPFCSLQGELWTRLGHGPHGSMAITSWRLVRRVSQKISLLHKSRFSAIVKRVRDSIKVSICACQNLEINSRSHGIRVQFPVAE